MPTELEQIVKKYVPFVSVYHSNGFDEKCRIVLPQKIIWTLQRRQEVQEMDELILYYRLHEVEIPKIELTDFFPMGEWFSFPEYNPLCIDKISRILIPRKDLDKVSIPTQNSGKDSREVVFEGNGNKILIYRAEDYEKYVKP